MEGLDKSRAFCEVCARVSCRFSCTSFAIALVTSCGVACLFNVACLLVLSIEDVVCIETTGLVVISDPSSTMVRDVEDVGRCSTGGEQP